MAVILSVNKLFTGGITIFPFIIIKRSSLDDLVLLNHEKIHIRQQLELLVFPFYLVYLLHYLYNLLKYRNHWLAYTNIIFEKEAFRHEKNFNYLKGRSSFAFLLTDNQ